MGLEDDQAKDWTAAEDERLRELLVKGMSAREIGIELIFTAVAVRTRAFRLHLACDERRPQSAPLPMGRFSETGQVPHHGRREIRPREAF